MARKGVEDFLILLVVALVILVALVALSPFFANIAPQTDKDLKVIESFSPGTIGFTGSTPARKSSIGNFDASVSQKHNLQFNKGLTISRGLGGTETKQYDVAIPDYYLDSMRKVTITFEIHDTNRYGNLQVYWNGRLEYDDNVDPRIVTIEIPRERLDKINTLKLDVTGPGLFFWASTVYELNDFSVDLEIGPGKIVAFPMSRSDIESFVRGELEFFGTGDQMQIRLNGQQIYNKAPEGVTKVGFNFSTAPLIIGENIISFDAQRETLINGASLSIFLLSGQLTHVREFNITKEQFESLRKTSGTVSIDMGFIFREGNLAVELNGNSLGDLTPSVGTNSLKFSSSDVHAGLNTITLRGTGEFEIKNVKIGYLNN